MLHNKKQNWKPFDMNKKPVKQYPFLVPFIWGASWLMTRRFRLKIEKENMEHIRPPYLVLSTHQGFSDYYIAPLALFPHRANYVSDMEGFAAFGEWLYRGIGCIGKRRYVSDVAVVKNIYYALHNKKQIVAVFPESRHSNVGTTSRIPGNMGKLAKLMKVPVVTLSVHGSYLAGPFWDEEHIRTVPMEARLTCIYTAQELERAGDKEVQQKIEEKLQYDEYRWQKEKGIAIRYKNRAEGLHMALYQCRACKTSFRMESCGCVLRCSACGAEWEMDEYGQLQRGGETQRIPDWYEWQRRNVEEEILRGEYRCDLSVRVEALPNASGFIPMGEGRLTQEEKGFTLSVQDKTLVFDHVSRESVQTEYNYRGRGACIVLSDRDCCYYIYSKEPDFAPTRIQFAGEYFYLHERKKFCVPM
ncbi:lysophospholipid acyltransferase family protein [Eisenbergiella porci]|uniref:lysophospholipid acyltransferase family protein n=1 Tax=Eisenbergiella porci TaxID=2652274 RepID=UPI002A814937|nr:lysophospholipid acyltransferase family protein [Eisenbergiella porci]